MNDHKLSTSRAAPVGKRTANPSFSRKVSNTFIAGIPYNVPSAHARQPKARVETAQTIEHHANKLVIDQALKPVERVCRGRTILSSSKTSHQSFTVKEPQ